MLDSLVICKSLIKYNDDMLNTDAAYFAGLIDGEGTISLRRVPQKKCKRGWNWRPLVQIHNSDEKMIKHVSKITERGFEHTYHSYKNKKLPALTWRITGSRDCLEICEAVLPYLITKKRHAELIIEACELILSLPKAKTVAGYEGFFSALTPRLTEIKDEFSLLNLRGVRWSNLDQ